MITAAEARQGTEKNDRLIEFMEMIEERIRDAMKQGLRSTCFGNWDPAMWDYERQAKEEFTKRGFSFKPTGYVGGIYQHTQDICW